MVFRLFASIPLAGCSAPVVWRRCRLQHSERYTSCILLGGKVSIYRGWRPSPTDIYTPAVANKTTPEVQAPSPPIHLRRAQPVLVLLPRTACWLSEIPPRFRPTSLAKQFARIANNICAVWTDPTARGKYLEGLLVGDRPNRKGFPPTVLRELQTLHLVHLELCRSSETATWDVLNRSVWDGSQRSKDQPS